ncbi:hypothetical protein ACERK3_16020 [Phycisphaerales bacterium AB-hyl4]|uniref:Uncharacterized protein n=1 Tax=Natronomicrosphaera hydrolytica TaxID=3242702 RepID=A0ABV4U859_9BACT
MMMRTGVMLLGLVLLTAGGCVSADRHVFESTSMRPATVTLVDTIEGETLWSKEIPPEHRLVVRLKRQGEPMGMRVTGEPATGLSWAIYETPRSGSNNRAWRTHVDDGELELEGRPVRLNVEHHAIARRDLSPTPEADEPRDSEADEGSSDDELARQEQVEETAVE